MRALHVATGLLALTALGCAFDASRAEVPSVVEAGAKADEIGERWDGVWAPDLADDRGRFPMESGWTFDPVAAVVSTPSARDQEGAQLGSAERFGAFHLELEFRFEPGEHARNPLRSDGSPRKPALLEHYGNSGIYIYDVYEIQIVDSNRSASTGARFHHRGPGGGFVAEPLDEGAEAGLELGSTVGQVACGYPYHQGVLAGIEYRNHTVPTDGVSWNHLGVWFVPPVFDGNSKVEAARLKVELNGVVTTRNPDGDYLRLAGGTGSGADREAALGQLEQVRGRVFLQSHWGSTVHFRQARIEPL